MKIVSAILLFLVLSSAAIGVCDAAVWFPEHPDAENQMVKVTLPKLGNAHGDVSSRITVHESNPGTVTLTINVTTWAFFYQTGDFETWLTIDDNVSKKLECSNFHRMGSAMGEFYTRTYSVTLSELSEGIHVLKICVTGNYYDPIRKAYSYVGNVSFAIDNKPPTIGDISIQNTTYTQNHLELACTVNEPYRWLTYSLDGKANESFTDNGASALLQAKTNLTDLTEGSHNLTVYACDMAGNVGESQTVTFAVDEPEPFPVLIILGVVVAVVLVVVDVLLIARRRRS